MQPAHAALGDRDVPYRRHGSRQLVAQRRPDGDGAQQAMLGCEPRQDRLEDGVLAAGHAAYLARDARPVADVEPRELRHRALLDRLVRTQHALEHDLGLGGNRERHRPARDQLHGLALQRARDLELVAAQIDIHLRGQQHRGMVADRDRELQRLAPRLRLPREDVEVMVGGDPRHHPVAAFQPEPGDGKIGAARLRVARDDDPRGYVGRRLALEPARHRQQGREIGRAVEDFVLHRAVIDNCRRDRARDRGSAQ